MSVPTKQVGTLEYPQDLINYLNNSNLNDDSVAVKVLNFQLIFDQDCIENNVCELWRLTERTYLRDTKFQGKDRQIGDKDYAIQAGIFAFIGGNWQVGFRSYDINSPELAASSCPIGIITLAKQLNNSQ